MDYKIIIFLASTFACIVVYIFFLIKILKAFRPTTFYHEPDKDKEFQNEFDTHTGDSTVEELKEGDVIIFNTLYRRNIVGTIKEIYKGSINPLYIIEFDYNTTMKGEASLLRNEFLIIRKV